jgi:hypothetical protein
MSGGRMISLRSLGAWEISQVELVADAFFPGPEAGSKLPKSLAQLAPGGFLSDTLAAVPLEPALGLRLALYFCLLGPVLLLRAPKTLRALPAAERSQVLSALLRSRVYAVRQLVMALKAVLALRYAQDPAVRAAMVTPRAVTPSSLLRRKPLSEVHHAHAAE